MQNAFGNLNKSYSFSKCNSKWGDKMGSRVAISPPFLLLIIFLPFCFSFLSHLSSELHGDHCLRILSETTTKGCSCRSCLLRYLTIKPRSMDHLESYYHFHFRMEFMEPTRPLGWCDQTYSTGGNVFSTYRPGESLLYYYKMNCVRPSGFRELFGECMIMIAFLTHDQDLGSASIGNASTAGHFSCGCLRRPEGRWGKWGFLCRYFHFFLHLNWYLGEFGI